MKITFAGGKKVNAEYASFEIPTNQGQQGGEGSAPKPFMLFNPASAPAPESMF